MSVKIKIKHQKPGTVFNAGPVAVRVMEHFADGKNMVITEIEVELEEDEVYLSPSAMLEGFTTRQLVEELFRRIGTEKEVIEDDNDL